MPNRESLKKQDYERRQNKLELINLKRMPRSFKMKLFNITQLLRGPKLLNSTRVNQMPPNLTELPTFLCWSKMMA
jgi:hypothetical protein